MTHLLYLFFTSSDFCLRCRPKHVILSYVKKNPVITYLSSKPVLTLNPYITSIYFKHCSYLQVFLVCVGEYFYVVDFWKKEQQTLLWIFGLASLLCCGLKIFCDRLRAFYFTRISHLLVQRHHYSSAFQSRPDTVLLIHKHTSSQSVTQKSAAWNVTEPNK